MSGIIVLYREMLLYQRDDIRCIRRQGRERFRQINTRVNLEPNFIDYINEADIVGELINQGF
jgi:hypothetical protein